MNAPFVLYVEDEECDVFFMQRAFRQAGLGERLVALNDGQRAIEYLAGTGPYADRERYPLPAVVLLDLNLPLISGFEVLAWIRGEDALADLPVAVFSSSDRNEDRERADELGAALYLLKPGSGMQFGVVAEALSPWLQHSTSAKTG